MLHNDIAFGPSVQLRDLISIRQISPVDLTRLYLDRAELPIRLNIVDSFGDDSTVFATSTSFEEAHPWLQHRPPVSKV